MLEKGCVWGGAAGKIEIGRHAQPGSTTTHHYNQIPPHITKTIQEEAGHGTPNRGTRIVDGVEGHIRKGSWGHNNFNRGYQRN